MDFKKFAQIALKDIHGLFSDRATLLIIIGAPLAITIIMGFAFGGGNIGGTAAQSIPIVVVNQDQGSIFANFGKVLTDTFIKPPEGLKGLISAEEMTDESAAKDRVRSGKAVAAILIPTDFSQSLSPTNPNFGDSKIKVTVYRDSGSPISADIVSAVVRQFLNRFASANIAVYAAGKVNPGLLIQAVSIAQDVAGASSQSLINVERAQNAPTTDQGQAAQGFNLLGYFAPAMAVFFLNFGMTFGAATLIEEREAGTLQRLITTPTNRLTILAGKLAGTYVNGVLQLTIFIFATILIAPLLGSKEPVWGTNVPGLILMVLIVVAGAIGFGTLIAAIGKTRQQVGVYASALLILMGIVGGAFFATDGPGPFGSLSKLTLNWWATNGFYTLTRTNDLAAVLPNIAVLLGMFVICFGAGVMLFNRRLDV